MLVVPETPPNYRAICDRFPIVEGKPVLFAWGDKIYAPFGGTVSPQLKAHEAVHGARQGADVEGWWVKYLGSAAFRLEEEVPAHVAEYKRFCELYFDRNVRARELMKLAARLTHPMYDFNLSAAAALQLIRQGLKCDT